MPFTDKLEINETSSVAVLWAESVWGILRGLETFSQILAPSGDGPNVNIFKYLYPFYLKRILIIEFLCKT